MVSRDVVSAGALTDARETFLTGIDFSVGYWLDFWRRTEDNSEAQHNALGHAVRAIIRSLEYRRCPKSSVELAVALNMHMQRRGRWHEWERLLAQVAEWAGPLIEAELRIQLEGQLSLYWFRLNRIDEVIDLATQQYLWAVGSGSVLGSYAAMIRMAEAYLNAERYDLALACAEEAYASSLSLGDPVKLADALINGARAALGLGLIDDAEQRLERAEALTAESRDADYCCKAQLFLGHAAAARKAWAAALRRFETALILIDGYGDLVGRGVVLSNMGRALTELGRWDEAESALSEALAILHYHGNVPAEEICRQRHRQLHERRGPDLALTCMLAEQPAVAPG